MSVKSLKSIINTQRGEIATILTLISVGLMLMGVVVGNVAVKQTTSTQTRASQPPSSCPNLDLICTEEGLYQTCCSSPKTTAGCEDQQGTGVTQVYQCSIIGGQVALGWKRQDNECQTACAPAAPPPPNTSATCSLQQCTIEFPTLGDIADNTRSVAFDTSDNQYYSECSTTKKMMSFDEAKKACTKSSAAPTETTIFIIGKIKPPNGYNIEDYSRLRLNNQRNPTSYGIDAPKIDSDGSYTITFKPENSGLNYISDAKCTITIGIINGADTIAKSKETECKLGKTYEGIDIDIPANPDTKNILTQTSSTSDQVKYNCPNVSYCTDGLCNKDTQDYKGVCTNLESRGGTWNCCVPKSVSSSLCPVNNCHSPTSYGACSKHGEEPSSLQCPDINDLCCMPKTASNLLACDKDKYRFDNNDTCKKGTGCSTDCTQCSYSSALDTYPAFQCTGTSTDSPNVTCEYYKNCDKEANADEKSQLGDCNTSKLNPDHGLRDDIACAKGGIGSVFVCRLDANGKPKWFKEFSEKTFYCTDDGKKNVVPPVPTESFCYPLAKENPFYADCSRTAKPEGEKCTYGSYWSVCLPDKDCPEDARYGVSLPYWCGKDNTGYVSNKFGECSNSCKGSAYNITPTPNNLCINNDEQRGEGKPLPAGKPVGECKYLICAIVGGASSHWIKAYATCDGNGNSNIDLGKNKNDDTSISCTLTAGKDTVTSDCSDYSPILKDSEKIPAQKPGATNPDCKAFKCGSNSSKSFSFKGTDLSKVYENASCADPLSTDKPSKICGYNSACELFNGKCGDRPTEQAKKDKCFKERGWKNGNDVAFNINLGCEAKYCCPTDYSKGLNDDQLVRISPAPSSGETSKSSGNGCEYKFDPDKLVASQKLTIKVSRNVPNSPNNAQLVGLVFRKDDRTHENPVQGATYDQNAKQWTFTNVPVPSKDNDWKLALEEDCNTSYCTNGLCDAITVNVKSSGSSANPPAAKCLDENIIKTAKISNGIKDDCVTCMKTKINGTGNELGKFDCSDDIQKINKYCNVNDVNKSLCDNYLDNDDDKKCKTSCSTSTAAKLLFKMSPQSYGNESFDQIVEARKQNLITAIDASLWVLSATRIPGLQRLYCDPFQGQCDYGVTPGIQQQVDASQNNNAINKTSNQIADNGNSLVGINLSVLDCCAITKGTEKIKYKVDIPAIIGNDKKTLKLDPGNPVAVIRDKDNKIIDILVFDVNEKRLKSLFAVNKDKAPFESASGGIFDPSGSSPEDKKAGIAKIKEEWKKVDNQRNVNKLTDDSRDLITLILSGSEDFKRGDNNRITDITGKTASESIKSRIDNLTGKDKQELTTEQREDLRNLNSLYEKFKSAEKYAKADPATRSKMDAELNAKDAAKLQEDLEGKSLDEKLKIVKDSGLVLIYDSKGNIINQGSDLAQDASGPREWTNPDGKKERFPGHGDPKNGGIESACKSDCVLGGDGYMRGKAKDGVTDVVEEW